MLILLDCRPLLAEGLDSERTRLIFSAAAALSRDKGVKWLLLVDQSYPAPAGPAAGIDLFPALADSTLLVHRSFPGRLGWRLWYDRLIPRLAGKHNVDWIMLTGGVAAAPRAKRGTDQLIPQCLWMPEKANPAEGKGYLPLYAGRLRESLSRVTQVFCFSAADRSWLAEQVRGTDPANGKITAKEGITANEGRSRVTIGVVSAWPSEVVAPLSPAEKEGIKRQYAAGKEYFLADVDPSDEEELTQLLKSFSLFKKRQLSNLQLILSGPKPSPESKLSQRLGTYKYREDIHWCEPGETEKRLTGAAYALLFPFERKTLGIPVLNAWKAEVPVIIGENSGFGYMAGDGVLVAERDDPASMAGHLMAVYKDEQLRKDLIGKGRIRVAAYNPQLSLVEIAMALNIQ